MNTSNRNLRALYQGLTSEVKVVGLGLLRVASLPLTLGLTLKEKKGLTGEQLTSVTTIDPKTPSGLMATL